jgi:TRAP-type C4-dicarboxylate transport system permease small subunit
VDLMSTPRPREDLPIRRIDRILAFMSLGLLVLSILCFFVILIGSATHASFGVGLSAVLQLIVYVAPVVAFILLLVVLISSLVRRARANKGR